MDSTHTKARYNQKSPKEFLQENAKIVRGAVYKIDEAMKGKFPEKTTSNEVADDMGTIRPKQRVYLAWEFRR